MRIKSLRAGKVRNLQDLDLSLGPINVVYGLNGSGKTSLLEAISLLGTGRSFRTSHIDTVIRQDETSCTVFAILADTDKAGAEFPLGVTRYRNGQLEAQLRGNRVASSARLAEQLPLLTINASTFALLEGGPAGRRHFIDWGAFHVEQMFHAAWLTVRRALKQRNSLLRRGKISTLELLAWDRELVQAGETLHQLRDKWFALFSPLFADTFSALDAPFVVDIQYSRGWDREMSLESALARSLESDQRRGFTGVGPQRADLRIRASGINAADVLSRGQQKLVITALKIAQGRLLGKHTGRKAIYLIDDLPAELDHNYRQQLCEALIDMGTQSVITCVEPADLGHCWGKLPPGQPLMFHVEHGCISQTN